MPLPDSKSDTVGTETKVPTARAMYALIDSLAPMYPTGVPVRVIREVAGIVAERQRTRNDGRVEIDPGAVARPDGVQSGQTQGPVVFQGSGVSGVLFMGVWPLESNGELFSGRQGELLRAAIEKGLKMRVQDVAVVCCSSYAVLASPDLAGNAAKILAGIDRDSIRVVVLLGGRRGVDPQGRATPGVVTEESLRFLGATQPAVVHTVALSDLFVDEHDSGESVAQADGIREKPKRQFWSDLKQVLELLNGGHA